MHVFLLTTEQPFGELFTCLIMLSLMSHWSVFKVLSVIVPELDETTVQLLQQSSEKTFGNVTKVVIYTAGLVYFEVVVLLEVFIMLVLKL